MIRIETDIKGDVHNVDILVDHFGEGEQNISDNQMVLSFTVYDVDQILQFIPNRRGKENYVSTYMIEDGEKVYDVYQRPYKNVGVKQTSMTEFILSFYN